MRLCALLLLAGSVPVIARASPTRDAEVPLLARLAPSAAEQHAASTHVRAQQLRSLLEALPSVTRAEVQLALPDASSAPLDAPLPSARATIVLQLRGSGPADAEIARLAQAVVPDLTERAIHVSRHSVAPPAPPAAPVRVGPFQVAPTSARILRLTLGLSLACNVLLAGLLLWRMRRTRPPTPKVDSAGRGRPAP